VVRIARHAGEGNGEQPMQSQRNGGVRSGGVQRGWQGGRGKAAMCGVFLWGGGGGRGALACFTLPRTAVVSEPTAFVREKVTML
jgi:hypothetical protein